jgi:hypothetical protein
VSLTDFIKYARETFDAIFDKPQFNMKCDIKGAPLTKNYATVGSAFDYAIRLFINKHNCALINDFPLVAEKGVREDKKRRQFINSFKEKRELFLNSELLINDLLSDCIVLAKLESVFRSGKEFPNTEIFAVDENDVKDLVNLINIIDHKLFMAKKQCILNPTFGNSSLYIGGADADIIIDGALIDIKTTKLLKFTRDYFRQLTGYYLLNKRENNINGDINRLGIYYSRFGLLYTFPIPEMKKIITIDGKEKESCIVFEREINKYNEQLREYYELP